MKLYNSLTKLKENFYPLKPGEVSIYVCGQTVYDYPHLGHARKAIVFDTLRNFFQSSGFKVNFVENITDIDDKILQKAKELQIPISALTERFIQVMKEDFAALGITPPNHQPKATEYLQQMINLIVKLKELGFAYMSEGDVLFRVAKYKSYGELSGKVLEQLQPSSRLKVELQKESPLDFVLWKGVKPSEQVAYPSPFGPGRPGWHIECSAMAGSILGESFDIHGGGLDLIFPHHENERAQSESANQAKMANFWVHNGFLQVNAAKMSKSLGNFWTIRDALKVYDPCALRLFMLRTHYRSPINLHDSALQQAQEDYQKLKVQLMANHTLVTKVLEQPVKFTCPSWNNKLGAQLLAALKDDLNTPLALQVLGKLQQKPENFQLLVQALSIFGLLPKAGLKKNAELAESKIKELLEKRQVAKAKGDYDQADEIRNFLASVGVRLIDTKEGTIYSFF